MQAESGSAVVYPNPANDLLNIKADDQSFDSYTITNSIGKTMLTGAIAQQQTQVNIKSLPTGMYFVTIKGTQVSVVRKFVKM